MPEIGATLREARTRARVDVSEVEAATKIRAKYLRALENEEWGLLPGPTYVKSFLRTYAEFLGLDAKLLVEEFRLRHERRTEPEPGAYVPPSRRERERRQRDRRPRPGLSPATVVAMSLAVLVAVLFVLGSLGSDGDGDTPPPPPRAATTAPEDSQGTSTDSERTPRPAARRVRLQIVPTGDVWVCLMDAQGRRLIPGVVLREGEASETFRSRRFELTLGTGNARLRINGRARAVPLRSEAIGYAVTSNGRRELAEKDRPLCT